jgi:hypothetical protein
MNGGTTVPRNLQRTTQTSVPMRLMFMANSFLAVHKHTCVMSPLFICACQLSRKSRGSLQVSSMTNIIVNRLYFIHVSKMCFSKGQNKSLRSIFCLISRPLRVSCVFPFKHAFLELTARQQTSHIQSTYFHSNFASMGSIINACVVACVLGGLIDA